MLTHTHSESHRSKQVAGLGSHPSNKDQTESRRTQRCWWGERVWAVQSLTWLCPFLRSRLSPNQRQFRLHASRLCKAQLLFHHKTVISLLEQEAPVCWVTGLRLGLKRWHMQWLTTNRRYSQSCKNRNCTRPIFCWGFLKHTDCCCLLPQTTTKRVYVSWVEGCRRAFVRLTSSSGVWESKEK